MTRAEFDNLGPAEATMLIGEWGVLAREQQHAAAEFAAMYANAHQSVGSRLNREHFLPYGRPEAFGEAVARARAEAAIQRSRSMAEAMAAVRRAKSTEGA